MRMDIISTDVIPDWGMPALPGIRKPKPSDEVPVEATVSNVRADTIKVKAWRMTGASEQAF